MNSSAVNETGPRSSGWRRFWMVMKVVELRVRFLALLAGTGLVFAYWDQLVNYYEKWARPAGDTSAVSDIEYYCPMHPSVVRSTTGTCPICGMPLSRRAKGMGEEALPSGVTARVRLSPERVLQAGLKTVEVGFEPLTETITTVGYITYDERRLARIASRAKGLTRVESLQVDFTGTSVRAGQPLAVLYSPELYQATQELLLARKRSQSAAEPRTGALRSLGGDPGELVRLAREKLELWGMAPRQIDQVLADGHASPRLPVLAPFSGVVITKNVVVGQYIAEGESMFGLADLSHVWAQAQVFEDQIGRISVGQSVEASVSAYPGVTFPGTVAFIDPTVRSATRTVDVRFDLDNADGRLRPGMFATVSLKAPVAESPAFRARLATAPARPERSGLARLTVEEQGTCPVTTLKLGAMGKPVAVEVQDRRVWLCCSGCDAKLQAQPARYLARLDPPPRDSVLTVPESAVIDTGERQIVYVESQPGVFEGRVVVLGPRVGDRYPVLEGLLPGEAVAAAGAFLIDAESRLTGGQAPPVSDSPMRSADAGSSPSHVR